MRIVWFATTIVVASVLALIQGASDALYASAASPGSFPSHLSPAVGARIYGALASVAPLPSFEAMLATYALKSGDAVGAQAAAVRLPDSTMRDELLGQSAMLRGDRRAALEYFLHAPDAAAVGREVNRQARRHPLVAAALERRLLDRLTALTTHPDAVAEANWRLGELLTRAAYLPSSAAHPIVLDPVRSQQAMNHYLQAADLAPLNTKYLLAAAAQSLLMGDLAGAQRFYQRGVDADPTNADSVAGLGVVAVREGDLAQARARAAAAAKLNPRSHVLAKLRELLR